MPTITAEFAFTHFLKELGQKIGERNTIINGVVLLLGLYLSFVDQMYETRENLSDYSQNESPDELGFFANAFMTECFPGVIKELNLQGM